MHFFLPLCLAALLLPLSMSSFLCFHLYCRSRHLLRSHLSPKPHPFHLQVRLALFQSPLGLQVPCGSHGVWLREEWGCRPAEAQVMSAWAGGIKANHAPHSKVSCLAEHPPPSTPPATPAPVRRNLDSSCNTRLHTVALNCALKC